MRINNMLNKYNLIVLKALLCVAPLAVTGKIVAMNNLKNEDSELNERLSTFKNVKTFTVSNDEKLVFIQHLNATAELIAVESGCQIGNSFVGVSQGKFNNDSNVLVVEFNDKTVVAIDANNGTVIERFK